MSRLNFEHLESRAEAYLINTCLWWKKKREPECIEQDNNSDPDPDPDPTLYLSQQDAKRLIEDLKYAVEESADHQTNWPVSLIHGEGDKVQIYVSPK